MLCCQSGRCQRTAVSFRAKVIGFVSDAQPPIVSHGPREMPIWGPVFRGLDPSDTRARLRIENPVSYIESMQAK